MEEKELKREEKELLDELMDETDEMAGKMWEIITASLTEMEKLPIKNEREMTELKEFALNLTELEKKLLELPIENEVNLSFWWPNSSFISKCKNNSFGKDLF
jgi:hypothetical protein